MKDIKSTMLFKKVYGGLIGGAIGDALGGPVEGMHYKFIRDLYPGGVKEVTSYDRRPEDFKQPGPDSGAYARSGKAGTYTDDTYFQLLITKTIVKKQGRITADDLADTWMEEMDTSRAWHSISNSFYRVALSRTPVRSAGEGNIPDNSSAMCIGPIGIINAGNPSQAALDAYDVTSLSHDGYSREAASVIAAAVAEAMNPAATIDSIIKASICHIPNRDTSLIVKPLELAIELADKARDTEELTAMFYEDLIVRWVRRSAIKGPDNERHSPSVDPLESVPCAIAMFYKTNGIYRDCVTASANFGRDCDTIACMAGYIAGAFNGVDVIPGEWIRLSNTANPDPDIEELAVGLTRAVIAERDRAYHRAELISRML